MSRSQHSTPTAATERTHRPGPLPDDWLVLTEADRAMAGMSAALDRTSRWQGDTD